MDLFWLDSVLVESPEALSRETAAETLPSKLTFMTGEDLVV